MYSKGTWLYGILLVVSASFTLQIYKFFERLVGKETLKLYVYVMFILVVIFVLIHSIKIKPSFFQIVFILLSFILSLNLVIFLPYTGEKTHVISYGLLGYLSMKDTACKNMNFFKSLFLAFMFALFINILDESFQRILPNRFGEIRDVINNIWCTFVGIILYYGFNKNKSSYPSLHNAK